MIDLPKDIFGITMHVTVKARENEFSRFIAVLDNLGLFKPQFSIVDLKFWVKLGIISPQSASYFVAGRASSYACLKLQTFVRSLRCCDMSPGTIFKLLQKWQKLNVFETENTFLFPLAELDCDAGFDDERLSYENVDFKDLKLL